MQLKFEFALWTREMVAKLIKDKFNTARIVIVEDVEACVRRGSSVPSLILLLICQQWALAMTFGAGTLIMPTLLNWRAILPRTIRRN